VGAGFPLLAVGMVEAGGALSLRFDLVEGVGGAVGIGGSEPRGCLSAEAIVNNLSRFDGGGDRLLYSVFCILYSRRSWHGALAFFVARANPLST